MWGPRLPPITSVEMVMAITMLPMGGDPDGAVMGWAVPVAADPQVMAAFPMPIAINPDVIRAGAIRAIFVSWRRWGFANDDVGLYGGRSWRYDHISVRLDNHFFMVMVMFNVAVFFDCATRQADGGGQGQYPVYVICAHMCVDNVLGGRLVESSEIRE